MQFGRFRKTLLAVMLATTFSFAGSSPAQAGYIESSYAPFAQALENAYDGIDNYDLDRAYSQAQAAHNRYLSFYKAGVGKVAASDLWQANQAMQVDLVKAWVVIGQRLHDKKDYDRALKSYQFAKQVSPQLPLIHYEIGFTQFTRGQAWPAAQALYEAKRLNRFPTFRQLINPIDQDFSVGAPPAELDTRIDNLLKDLNKSPDYPITLNFATGKQRNAVMIPGIGVNMRNLKGSYFNLFLAAPADIVSQQLGESPPAYEGLVDNRQLSLHPFHKTLYTVGLDTDAGSVYSIQADEPGFSLYVNQQYLSIGEPAEKVMKVLGKAYGFQRQSTKQHHIRDTLAYPELGLNIGITYDDKIALFSIHSLE